MATIEVREYQHKTPSGEAKTIKKYKATITLKGCPRTSKTFDRKTDANEWANKTEYEYKHQRAFGKVSHHKKTLSEAIERYSQNLALSNARRYKEVLPFLNWWEHKLGSAKLSEISKDRILQQRDLLKNHHIRNNPKLSKLSNARVNRYVGALNCLLNEACTEWGWLAENPIAEIKLLPEPTGRSRYLQEDELKTLIQACKKSDNIDLHTIVVLAITTGARRSEIEKIQIPNIDLKQRKILLPITKNKKPRVLYIADPAYQLIKEVYERPKPPQQKYLFASPFDFSRPNGFRSAWEKARERAMLENFHFHDLRHSAASFLAQHGAGLHEISEILGHSSIQVTMRYIHLIKTHTSAIVESTAAKVFSYEQHS